MTRYLNKFIVWLYTVVGDLKWATTKPSTKAKQIRDVLGLDLKAGQIIFRLYDYYWDSAFLPGNPYTHSGIIVNSQGEVIHSVAEGVEKVDIIDFICNTDGFIIMEPKYPNESQILAKKFAYAQIGKPYDNFLSDPDKWYCNELTAGALRASGIIVTAILRKFGIGPLKFKKKIYLYEDFIEHCKVVYEFKG